MKGYIDTESLEAINKELAIRFQRAQEMLQQNQGAQAELEASAADLAGRNALYEQGVYGLPQAAQEIKGLKANLTGEGKRVAELVSQVNQLAARLEDASDENAELRRRAGVPEGAAVDIKGVKLAKELAIAQLRSVNALLERQARAVALGFFGGWRRTEGAAAGPGARVQRPSLRNLPKTRVTLKPTKPSTKT